MTPKSWKPAIRQRGNAWVVDCGHAFGERRRKQFATVEERDAYTKEMIQAYKDLRDQKKVEAKNKSVVRLTSLPESDRSDIMSAVLAIEKAGGNAEHLLEAATYYAENILSVKLRRTVSELVEDYVAAKKEAERSPRTITSSKLRLASFVKDYGKRLIHSISTRDCESWLKAGKWKGTTKNDQRRELSGLFEFAIGRDFCKLNPVKPIATVNIRKGKPPVFTVEQMRKLLHTAAQFVPDEYIIESRSPLRGSLQPVKDAAKIVKAREQLVPYIALGLFAGLRPESELQKLDWSAIQFEADYPYIRAKGKTGERDVTMSANLIEWLAPYRRVSGKIGYSKKRLAAVVAAAGLTWSPDVMRHSFGSYHLAHHRNITETAHQMGNSTKMVKDHYENVRTAKEATEYFATVPDNKIIGLFKTPAFARAAG